MGVEEVLKVRAEGAALIVVHEEVLQPLLSVTVAQYVPGFRLHTLVVVPITVVPDFQT
jgi:hypothetical protein